MRLFLKKLNLEKNEIEQIETNGFQGLNNLEELFANQLCTNEFNSSQNFKNKLKKSSYM